MLSINYQGLNPLFLYAVASGFYEGKTSVKSKPVNSVKDWV
jgi:hypothetical protein